MQCQQELWLGAVAPEGHRGVNCLFHRSSEARSSAPALVTHLVGALWRRAPCKHKRGAEHEQSDREIACHVHSLVHVRRRRIPSW
jgi:hypothetical protein